MQIWKRFGCSSRRRGKEREKEAWEEKERKSKTRERAEGGDSWGVKEEKLRRKRGKFEKRRRKG